MLPVPCFEGFGGREALTIEGCAVPLYERGINHHASVIFGHCLAHFGADVVTGVIVIIVEIENNLVIHGDSFLFWLGRFDLSIRKYSRVIGHKTPFMNIPAHQNKNPLGQLPQADNR
jgi:hypothetical protein